MINPAKDVEMESPVYSTQNIKIYRGVTGGSWRNIAWGAVVLEPGRGNVIPVAQRDDVGFRVVRSR